MNSLDEELVPYEESLDLKELGFNEPCFGYYRDGRICGVNKWDRKDWEFHVISNKEITNVTNEIVIAPTFSQAFRWFRKNHKLHPAIISATSKPNMYTSVIESLEKDFGMSVNKTPVPYEKAELDCLRKLIEIVKEKK